MRICPLTVPSSVAQLPPGGQHPKQMRIFPLKVPSSVARLPPGDQNPKNKT